MDSLNPKTLKKCFKKNQWLKVPASILPYSAYVPVQVAYGSLEVGTQDTLICHGKTTGLQLESTVIFPWNQSIDSVNSKTTVRLVKSHVLLVQPMRTARFSLRRQFSQVSLGSPCCVPATAASQPMWATTLQAAAIRADASEESQNWMSEGTDGELASKWEYHEISWVII